MKEAVLPWNRFRRVDGTGVDSVLGPEMRSTGEVMGISTSFGEAYAKSQAAAFGALPISGSIFLSLSEKDKADAIEPARELQSMGFELFTTSGTHDYLANHGVNSTKIRKASEASSPSEIPTSVELITQGRVGLVINTPLGRGAKQDGWMIRTAAVSRSLPCITTIAGFRAAVAGIKELHRGGFHTQSLQRWISEND